MKLPVDICEHILSYCNASTFATCGKINRGWYDVVSSYGKDYIFYLEFPVANTYRFWGIVERMINRGDDISLWIEQYFEKYTYYEDVQKTFYFIESLENKYYQWNLINRWLEVSEPNLKNEGILWKLWEGTNQPSSFFPVICTEAKFIEWWNEMGRTIQISWKRKMEWYEYLYRRMKKDLEMISEEGVEVLHFLSYGKWYMNVMYQLSIESLEKENGEIYRRWFEIWEEEEMRGEGFLTFYKITTICDYIYYVCQHEKNSKYMEGFLKGMEWLWKPNPDEIMDF